VLPPRGVRSEHLVPISPGRRRLDHHDCVSADEPGAPEINFRGGNGARRLWLQCALWAALALAAGLGASITVGWGRAVLIVLTVLLGGLVIWVGMFAILASLAVRAVSMFRPGEPMWSLIPWWGWALASLAVGAVAGADAYPVGPANLIAVPLMLIAIAATLTSRATMAPRTRQRVCGYFAVIAIASTCVGLTIFLQRHQAHVRQLRDRVTHDHAADLGGPAE
jgi:hypothetical protein